MKLESKQWITSLIFIIIGIGMIIGGRAIINSNSKFKERAVKTVATVQDVKKRINHDDKKEYEVYLTYEVDGVIYNKKEILSSYVSEGSEKTIYCDKDNPSVYRKTVSPTGGIIMCTGSVVFIALGIGIIFIIIKGKNKE